MEEQVPGLGELEWAAGRPVGAIIIRQLRVEQDCSHGSICGEGEKTFQLTPGDRGVRNIDTVEGGVPGYFQVSGLGDYTGI